jgi:hypothetical protein
VLPPSSTSLLLAALRTSETAVDNYFTRQYIPGDNSELQARRRENLKSHNEEVAYKIIINCTNTVELRNLDRYLYKIKCKWENRIKEFQLDVE